MPTFKLTLQNAIKREKLATKILKMIEEEGPIGRNRLQVILKLSCANKGRYIIDELVEKGLVAITTHGAIVKKNWRGKFAYQLYKSARTLRELARGVKK